MIKTLTKVENSQGFIIDKPILEFLKVKANDSFEITTKNGGLFLKPLKFKDAYKEVSKRHRKSLDKLGK